MKDETEVVVSKEYYDQLLETEDKLRAVCKFLSRQVAKDPQLFLKLLFDGDKK